MKVQRFFFSVANIAPHAIEQYGHFFTLSYFTAKHLVLKTVLNNQMNLTVIRKRLDIVK